MALASAVLEGTVTECGPTNDSCNSKEFEDLLSGLDLTLVALFQDKTYFPKKLCSAPHKVGQSFSYVSVIHLWHSSLKEYAGLAVEQEFKECHVVWQCWFG